MSDTHGKQLRRAKRKAKVAEQRIKPNRKQQEVINAFDQMDKALKSLRFTAEEWATVRSAFANLAQTCDALLVNLGLPAQKYKLKNEKPDAPMVCGTVVAGKKCKHLPSEHDIAATPPVCRRCGCMKFERMAA